jgi:hypothetical protein
MAAVYGDSETYERETTVELVPFKPQSVLESPNITTRTAGDPPDIVLTQARFDPAEVSEALPALARTW